MAPRLVPHAGKGVVEWSEEVHQENEAVKLVGEGVSGIISESREIDGGLESKGALALDSIRSVFRLSV